MLQWAPFLSPHLHCMDIQITNVYTIKYQHSFIRIAYAVFKNQRGLEMCYKWKYTDTVFYIYLCIYLNQCSLFLHVYLSYCLISFYFSLKLNVLLFLVEQTCYPWILWFYLLENVLISPSFFKVNFARCRILSWQSSISAL